MGYALFSASGYTTPTPRKESHSYLKLRTSKAQQETPNPPIVEVQNSDIYDTPYQTREGLQGTDAPPPPDKETVNGEGYETPPPPEKGTPPEEAYANQGSNFCHKSLSHLYNVRNVSCYVGL